MLIIVTLKWAWISLASFLFTQQIISRFLQERKIWKLESNERNNPTFKGIKDQCFLIEISVFYLLISFFYSSTYFSPVSSERVFFIIFLNFPYWILLLFFRLLFSIYFVFLSLGYVSWIVFYFSKTLKYYNFQSEC